MILGRPSSIGGRRRVDARGARSASIRRRVGGGRGSTTTTGKALKTTARLTMSTNICVDATESTTTTTAVRVSMGRAGGRSDARVGGGGLAVGGGRRGVRASASASAASTEAYDLDFVAKPSLEERVASVGIGVAVASAYVAMRASTGAAPLTPLGRVVAAVLGLLGAVVARACFVERRYADALVSHKVAADDADSEFVRVDGIDVHFKRAKATVSGGECRRVVECVHGFGANLTSWTVSDSMAKLSRALEADVLAHDSCGFGLTERSVDVSRYTRASDARTCCAVLREGDPEGTKSRVLVGHSLGAVSAALACALEKIDHVVLVAPAIIQAGYKPKTSKDAHASRGRRVPMVFRLAFAFFAAAFSTSAWCLISLYKPFLEFLLHQLVRSKGFWNKGLRAAIDASKRDSMPEGWIDGYRKPSVVKNWDSGMFRLVLAGAAAANSPREIFADAFARARATSTSAIDEEDAIRALAESDARVLIVHGENDVIVPASNSRKLAETLGAELKIIPACGHMPQEERCDEFVRVVRDFIV